MGKLGIFASYKNWIKDEWKFVYERQGYADNRNPLMFWLKLGQGPLGPGPHDPC
jgi:predicted component of type VI protein secretion system